jgi:hypothetical protein
MKVRRHFNLDRIGKKYESIEIEVETETVVEAVDQIETAWRFYCKMIAEGTVQ